MQWSHRIIYFSYTNRQFIILNGFVKKTSKTPPSEIELAKKIGTTQAVISRIENGTTNIGIDFLEKIAQAFNKKVEFNIV